MVNYQCYRCGYTISNKSKIINHFNRKSSCNPVLNNIYLDDYKEYILNGLSYEEYQEITKDKSNISQKSVKNQSNFECSFCNKKYVHNQSLHKHLKTCKEKRQEEEVKESMIELVKLLNKKLEDKDKKLENKDKELDKQNRKFEKELTKREKELDKNFKMELDKRDKQIFELIKKAGISNSTINVQNNIKLLSYSDTDRSHLTDKDILKCLKHSNFCIPYLIKKVHFDVNKPENHNVYISNLKNKYVMMYDGNKWECKDREEQISNLMDDNEGIIEYKLEEWLEKGVKYPEMMKKFNTYIEKKDNNKVINIIKDEIKLLLYNNRNVVNKECSNKAIELIET
jgi:hypothetical protein